MSKGFVKYDNATIAAVISALLAGATHKEIQDQYGPHPDTQRRWLKEYGPPEALTVDSDGKKTEKSLGDLIVDYSNVLFRTLTIQAETFGDTNWLLAQDADKVAILHGVLADKGSAILNRLAALQREQDKREREQAGHTIIDATYGTAADNGGVS